MTRARYRLEIEGELNLLSEIARANVGAFQNSNIKVKEYKLELIDEHPVLELEIREVKRTHNRATPEEVEKRKVDLLSIFAEKPTYYSEARQLFMKKGYSENQFKAAYQSMNSKNYIKQQDGHGGPFKLTSYGQSEYEIIKNQQN